MTPSPSQRGSEQPDPDDGAGPTEPTWYTSWQGPFIVGVYLVATLVVMAISATELSFLARMADAYEVAVGWIRAIPPVGASIAPAPDAPAWLTDRRGLPSLRTTIPLDVYLFGLAGALTRFLLTFVRDIATLPIADRAARNAGAASDAPGRATDGRAHDPDAPGSDENDGDDDDLTPDLELLQLVLGLPAAVYLAAGVFLVGTQISDLLQRFEPTVTFVIVSYLVGFYVTRSYSLLGDVADRLLEPVDEEGDDEQGSMFARTFNLSAPRSTAESAAAEREATAETAADSPAGAIHIDWRGRVLFVAAILVALIVLVAILEDGQVDQLATDPRFGVPPDVYLYSVMGGVGYVFTKLFVDVERSRRSVIESSVRIFAGVFLAIGIYALLDPVEGTTAAVSFLVGLYLNVAVMRFDALAEQFFDRLSRVVRGREDTEERRDDSGDG